MRRKPMYGFIYLTTNTVNGKKYVGMCKNTHRDRYLGSGKLLKEAIKKYGRDSFERVILEECDTFESLCLAEQKWILNLNAVESEEYYNLFDGGFGGCSKNMKKYWSMFTDDERKKVRNWKRPNMSGNNNPMFGKKHSEETKMKIGSKSVNRNWGRKTSVKGKNNPRAKRVKIIFDNGHTKTYDCLKDFADEFNFNYSSIKSIYKSGKMSERYGVTIVNA
jgi:group I intron endonuclease